MNRRSLLKAAAGAVAAACGLKVAEAGPTIRFQHSFVGQITSVGWSGMSPNDVRFLETRTYSVDEVKRWYRIPDGTI